MQKKIFPLSDWEFQPSALCRRMVFYRALFYRLQDMHNNDVKQSWESQEAIDKHHATPMMDKIIELRNKYDLHMKVERYIEDTAGVPDKDKSFIKE